MFGIPYPWRAPETTPFHLLLTEMLLRQTDAPKVANLWGPLVQLIPDPGSVLFLDDDVLHQLVSSLGLVEQRAQSLKACCEVIVNRHRGRVPHDPYQLLELPHIGIYSAAAVACFAYNRRNPIVDGNLLRVLGRLTGSDFGLDNRRSEEVWQLAWAILPERNYRLHNYGILDFSAQICTARVPKCGSCQLRSRCAHFLSGRS